MLSTRAAHRKDLRGNPARMTHQHFREIAAIIRAMEGDTVASWCFPRRSIAEHFAKRLGRTNGNFNTERFLAACLHGLEG